MESTMLVLFAVITAYAIGVTVLLQKKNSEISKAKRMLELQSGIAENNRVHAADLYRKLLTQREEMNEEIHKLERQVKIQLDANARLMRRIQRERT